jgi:hypothetical protein
MRVTLTFPAIKYSPPYESTDARVLMRLIEHQRELYGWGGFPLWKYYVPGGLLDSTGLEIPIVGLIGGYKEKPWWYPLATIHWPFKFDYVYGPPQQLSLEQFRKKVTGLVVRQRGVGRDMKRLKSAQTYQEIIASQASPDWYKETSTPVTMEIEVPNS